MKYYEITRSDNVPVNTKCIKDGDLQYGLNKRMFPVERHVFAMVDGTLEQEDMYVSFQIDWNETLKIINDWLDDIANWKHYFKTEDQKIYKLWEELLLDLKELGQSADRNVAYRIDISY